MLNFAINILNMKKEDYQSHNNGCPIDIVFIPQAVQADFKQKIKLQIAFYRNTKVCKSTPVKFTKSSILSNKIVLEQQKLPFCTTINFDQASRTFETKIISIQLALQVDGIKDTLDGKVDLKDILIYQNSFQRSNLAVDFRNGVKLIYKIIVKIPNLPINHHQQPKSPYKANRLKEYQQKSSQKEIKIAQKSRDQDRKQLSPSKLITQKQNQYRKNPTDQFQFQPQNAKNLKPQKLSRQKQLQIQCQQLQKNNKNAQTKLKQISIKCQELSTQNQRLKNRIKQLQTANQLKQRQIVEKDKYIVKIGEEKNSLARNGVKNHQLQQIVNRKNGQIDKLTQQISHFQTNISELKHKVQQLRRSQSQTRIKYEQSQRKNIALTSQISQLSYKAEKFQRQNQKSLKKIQKLQKQLNQNSFTDLTINRAEQQSKIKGKDQEIQKLTKLLQNKQEIIRMIKKQNEAKKIQSDEDIKQIQKQNKQLRQEMEKLKNGKKDDSNIQLKLQNEKLKKQCAQAKRQEKKMLAEKSEIESRNKEMHLEIVTLKQKIGKILNIVQFQGTGDLYAQVADCVS